MPGLGKPIIFLVGYKNNSYSWQVSFLNESDEDYYYGYGNKEQIDIEPVVSYFIKKRFYEWKECFFNPYYLKTQQFFCIVVGKNEDGNPCAYIEDYAGERPSLNIRTLPGKFVYPNKYYNNVTTLSLYYYQSLIMTGLPVIVGDINYLFFSMDAKSSFTSTGIELFTQVSPLQYYHPLCDCRDFINSNKDGNFNILTTRRREGVGDTIFYEDEELLPFVPLLKNNTYFFTFGAWCLSGYCDEKVNTQGIYYYAIPIYSYDYSSFGGSLFFPNSYNYSQRCDTLFFDEGPGTSSKNGLVFALTTNSERDIYVEEIDRGNTAFVWGSGSEMVTSYKDYKLFIEGATPAAFKFEDDGNIVAGCKFKQKEFSVFIYKDADSPWVRFKIKTGNGHIGISRFILSGGSNRLYYQIFLDTYEGKNIKMFNIVRDPCSRYFLKWQTRNFVDDCFPFNKVSKETDTISQNTYENTEGVQINNIEIDTQWKLNTDWIKPSQIERFKELFISEDVYLLDTVENESIPVIVKTSEFVHKTLQNNSNKGFNVQITVQRRQTITT